MAGHTLFYFYDSHSFTVQIQYEKCGEKSLAQLPPCHLIGSQKGEKPEGISKVDSEWWLLVTTITSVVRERDTSSFIET